MVAALVAHGMTVCRFSSAIRETTPIQVIRCHVFLSALTKQEVRQLMKIGVYSRGLRLRLEKLTEEAVEVAEKIGDSAGMSGGQNHSM